MFTVPASTLNRRSFLQLGSFAAAYVLMSPTGVEVSYSGLVDTMMREAVTAKVNVIPLGSNLYVIENTGGNITVLDGPDGKPMVDAGISGSHPQILAALEGISANPLKEAIGTHWHFDHTGGNPWLHEAGARITAYKNTRKHMAVAKTVSPWNYTFPPVPALGLPTRLLDADTTLSMNGTQIDLVHATHAHTDGDLVIAFKEGNVIAAADTFWNCYYPFIDCEAGGTIDGMISATRTNLLLADDGTIIVPGHGPVATKRDLQEYCDMLVRIHTAVMSLKRHSMTIEEVVAAKPTARFDARWGQYAVAPDDFVRLVYSTVCCDENSN
jgi:glyoxylase-like metal-dependent hydrolase (beta-lactamase superfamily II)